MRLDLPADATIQDVTSLGLPSDWRENEAITQKLGLQWLRTGTSLGLWVPSYVEPDDVNMLINPAHVLYPTIKLTVERNPFEFDPRLFNQS